MYYTHKKFKTRVKSLVLTKVYRAIKLNQEAWLRPYIDINTELRKNGANDFEKDFFKLINNTVFRKTKELSKKIQSCQTYNNRSKNKLFTVRTKLSQKKIFQKIY